MLCWDPWFGRYRLTQSQTETVFAGYQAWVDFAVGQRRSLLTGSDGKVHVSFDFFLFCLLYCFHSFSCYAICCVLLHQCKLRLQTVNRQSKLFCI